MLPAQIEKRRTVRFHPAPGMCILDDRFRHKRGWRNESGQEPFGPMQRLNTKQVTILGLGKSGYAAAELALTHGARVRVLDHSGGEPLRERAAVLTARGVEVCLEWSETEATRATDLVVISPGIPDNSRLGAFARRLAAPSIGEIEFGFRFCSCPLLAVTGTNGKTTVTELLTHCLRQTGYRAMAAGNVGTPLSEAARRSAELDFLVVEVSSFQLETIQRFEPLAAAILNITPDHLDRHGSMSNYRQAKARLLANMKDPSRVVLRNDLTAMEEINTRPVAARAVTFGSAFPAPGGYGIDQRGHLCRRQADGRCEALLDSRSIRLPGRHNQENVLAVLALGQAAGVPAAVLAAHVSSYVPERHRLEVTAQHEQVRYVNDSKATNPDSMKQAILTLAGSASAGKNILLIAGGLDKGVDFAEPAPVLSEHVREVFLIGTCRERLAKRWHGVVSCRMFSSLGAAFEGARESARPGDTVLFSPGCASQDMFVDYAHRGQEFCDLVERSIGE